MMIESVDFKSLVDQVMKDTALGHMRPVMELRDFIGTSGVSLSSIEPMNYYFSNANRL